ncbi:MBL fold metallo-hydrolase [Candidatus Peregrinibacteria bacterium]|nr:MBL fold metallo-hydrolase [Candidatus Peregrinibacteria bacterium]
MTHKIRLASGILILTLLLATREVSLHAHGKTVIHFFDVGQGDSTLIVSPSGKQILIDGGPDFSALEGLGRAMPFFDRTIDLLVLSHPQTDHILAFPEILRRYNVSAVLMTGIAYNLPRYEKFLTLLRGQKIPVIIANPAKDIDAGDGLVLDIVWPPPVLFGEKIKEVNNSSIVLRVLYGNHSALFTGDMETSEENEVLRSGADLRADIIKVPHHGSKTSSSTGFLLVVRPQLAVISVGKENTYGHPNKGIVDRYARFGIPVRTTMAGTITLTLAP